MSLHPKDEILRAPWFLNIAASNFPLDLPLLQPSELSIDVRCISYSVF